MAHYLGNRRIIVTSDSGKSEVRQSEHIVLDGDRSIYHHFGYGGDKRTIKAYLLDNWEDLPLIRHWYRVGSSVVYTDAWNKSGPYKIWEMSWDTVFDTSRDHPVYLITMTLASIRSGSF